MDCHKCKKPMVMTPACPNCGRIPIAEASFKQLENEKKVLIDALTDIVDRLEKGIHTDMANHLYALRIRDTVITRASTVEGI